MTTWSSLHEARYSLGMIFHASTSLTVTSRRLSKKEFHMRAARRPRRTALSEILTNLKPRKPKSKRNQWTHLISSYKNMLKSTRAWSWQFMLQKRVKRSWSLRQRVVWRAWSTCTRSLMTQRTAAFKIRSPTVIASDSQKSNARAWPPKRTEQMPIKPCTTKSSMIS